MNMEYEHATPYLKFWNNCLHMLTENECAYTPTCEPESIPSNRCKSFTFPPWKWAVFNFNVWRNSDFGTERKQWIWIKHWKAPERLDMPVSLHSVTKIFSSRQYHLPILAYYALFLHRSILLVLLMKSIILKKEVTYNNHLR